MAADTIQISQLLDHIGVIILVIDSDQRISFINRRGCEILGHEKEDILGKNWFDNFLPEKIREDIKTVFRKLMAQEIELAEYFDNVVLAKGGQERIIGWRNTLLKNDSGAVVGTFSWGENITERRKTDEKHIQELQDRVTELMSMKMRIPICSIGEKDLNESIKKHYRCISTEGKCSECLRVLKMASEIKE